MYGIDTWVGRVWRGAPLEKINVFILHGDEKSNHSVDFGQAITDLDTKMSMRIV